jgi:hypothetical protein
MAPYRIQLNVVVRIKIHLQEGTRGVSPQTIPYPILILPGCNKIILNPQKTGLLENNIFSLLFHFVARQRNDGRQKNSSMAAYYLICYSLMKILTCRMSLLGLNALRK